MTIDASKTSPEKLAEMNDALITDNRYLRGRVAQLESEAAATRDTLKRYCADHGITVEHHPLLRLLGGAP